MRFLKSTKCEFDQLLRFCLLFLAAITATTASKSQVKAPDALRQDIDAARQKVYPALVNIAVVVRYFNAGRAQRSNAGGSGVIVSPEGYVITNFHVAGHTTRITCTLTNGESLEAEVVTDDPLTDLSVLKLKRNRRADPKAPFAYASLGDSDALQVGDYVLAMGNPLLLSSSVTLGIVSNTKRVFTDAFGTDLEDQTLEEGEKTGLFTRWIQHDALILPGNSGGPLVNMKGEVVGINELGGSGVGFAIPSNIVKQVYEQAVHDGVIHRGWLGLSLLPVGKLDRSSGALISAVWPGSPAAKAGVEPGDILLSIDDQPTTARFFEEIPPLYQAMAALPAGKQVTLKVLRNNSTLTIPCTVIGMERFLGREEELRSMGITVQEITAPMALLERYPNKEGVLITGVRPGFPFESAKPTIAAEDVVLAVGDKKVNSPDELRQAFVGLHEDQPVAVTFRHGDEVIVTAVKAQAEKPGSENTELPKAWIGIKTQVLVPEVAQALKMPEAHGFRITEVLPYTEAEKSGLKPGDVITMINKEKLTASRLQDAPDLHRIIEDLAVGENAALTIVRAGKQQQIPVKLEATPTGAEQARNSRQKEFEFTVRDILPLDRMEERWSKGQAGVIVVETTEGGWANGAGLQSSDLILAINGQQVGDVGQFDQTMKSILAARPKVITVFVRRGHRTHFVFIEPVWDKLGVE